MQASQLPVKFTKPFADGAGAGFIRAVPTASQIGITNGAASLTDGFPPVCFLPVASGGIPPAGVDFNGILYQDTAWARWQAAGGTVPFDQAFANAIGGYPYGSVVQSTTSGKFWASVADNNTTNPDGGSAANWISFGTSYTPPTAAIESTLSPTADKVISPSVFTIVGVAGSNPTWATLSGTGLLTVTQKSVLAIDANVFLGSTNNAQQNTYYYATIYKNGVAFPQASNIQTQLANTPTNFNVQYYKTIFVDVGDTLALYATVAAQSGLSAASILASGTYLHITKIG